MEEISLVRRQRHRVVLVVLPFQGHINPILELAKILHSRGFPITIAHPEFNSPDPSTHPEFDYLQFGGFSAGAELLGADGDFEMARAADLISTINSRCQEPFRLAVEALMEEEEGGVIGSIIYDQYMFFAQSVAYELNLKGICLRTSNAISLLVFASPRSTQQPFSESEAEKELDEMGIGDVFRALEPLRGAAYKDTRAAVNKALSTSAAIIVNTMDCLEHQALEYMSQVHFLPPILPIGPFHKMTGRNSPGSSSLLEEDSSCIPWLDKQQPRSVLFISFGSMAAVTAAEFIEMAWGLEAAKLPFLWVIRPGLIHGGHAWERLMLAENLDKMIVEGRGHVVKWAPQKQVLTHPAVGGFWSHCGWNSTLESICDGVPLICRPFLGDQFSNAEYAINVWKVGLGLKDNRLEREEMERCIGRLMVGKEGEELRARAGILKEKAEWALKGGSCKKHLDWLDDLILSV